MRRALAMLAVLAAALWAAPALADPSPKLDLAAWVSQNTDLAPSHIAIAGPENVYSLEPLGPRLPTGEVLALVRTEAVSAEWGDAHQFQSWDAHLLFDCLGGRVRVLRSASYADRDRGGAAKADERGDAWFSPQATTPAATLLAAACDPEFNWPLRETSATPPPPRASFVQTSAVTSPVTPQAPEQIERAAVPRLPDLRAEVVVLTAAAGGGGSILPMPKPATAASPDMAQFATAATATATDLPLTSHQALQAPREPRRFSSFAAATRTCRRLAGAGRSWFARRVEIAFHQDQAPARGDRGVIRQAQAY